MLLTTKILSFLATDDSERNLPPQTDMAYLQLRGCRDICERMDDFKALLHDFEVQQAIPSSVVGAPVLLLDYQDFVHTREVLMRVATLKECLLSLATNTENLSLTQKDVDSMQHVKGLVLLIAPMGEYFPPYADTIPMEILMTLGPSDDSLED